MRHTYATGFVVSTIGVDPINTFNSFLTAYGGKDIVTKDGKFHGPTTRSPGGARQGGRALTTMFKEGTSRRVR